MTSVFSVQSFISESSPFTGIALDDKNTYRSESFFMEGLDFLVGMQKEMVMHRAGLYRAVSESGTNMVAVHEAFSDFFGYIKNFIKKIINFVKKLLAKFWVRMNSMFLSDKYITKHKDQLKKFGKDHEFDFNGFEYTFGANVPRQSVLEDLKEAIDVLADVSDSDKDSKKFKDAAALKSAYKTFTTGKCESSYLDKERGEILGCKPITESDFKDELFKVFRDGESKKVAITANATRVSACLFDFENYAQTKKSTEHQRDEVERAYTAIEKAFDRIHNAVFGKTGKDIDVLDIVDNLDEERTQLIDVFAKEKAIEVQEVSNLHIMAFTAKLDALKDQYGQDKAVLYQAFKKILAKEKMTASESAEFEEFCEHNDIDAIVDTHVRCTKSGEGDQTGDNLDNSDVDRSVGDATDSGNDGGDCCA